MEEIETGRAGNGEGIGPEAARAAPLTSGEGKTASAYSHEDSEDENPFEAFRQVRYDGTGVSSQESVSDCQGISIRRRAWTTKALWVYSERSPAIAAHRLLRHAAQIARPAGDVNLGLPALAAPETA